MEKNKELYLAILVAMGFVFIQHKEKTFLMRAGIAGVSGGFGYTLAPDVAEMFGRGETLTASLLTIFAYVAFDTVGALIADREAVKGIISRRLGGKGK